MFQQLFHFVRKEMLHIVRDGRTMLILLVLPVVMMLLFGYAVTNELRHTRLAIVDPVATASTQTLTERLRQNPRFVVIRQQATPRQLLAAFRRNEVDAALVFAPTAQSAQPAAPYALQILLDGSEPNQASIRLSYLQTVVRQETEAELSAPFAVTGRLLFNPQQRSEFNFVPGVLAMILILICAMMAAVSIVREKEMGTMEVLLASPLPPMVVVAAKLIPYFLLSCVNLGTTLGLSVWLIGVPIKGSVVAFLGLCLLYILVALALGLLVSTLARTQLVALMVAVLFILPTIYFSGMVFPIESMPEVLQWISVVVPARWFLSAARKLMIQGSDTIYIWREVAVLCAMLVGIVGIALNNYKLRLE